MWMKSMLKMPRMEFMLEFKVIKPGLKAIFFLLTHGLISSKS